MRDAAVAATVVALPISFVREAEFSRLRHDVNNLLIRIAEQTHLCALRQSLRTSFELPCEGGVSANRVLQPNSTCSRTCI